MAKEITISNNMIEVTISTFGAELQSMKKNGEEYLWDGNPEVWSGRAPILFPICGGLKDDKYIFEGREYTLPKHGFAKLSEFEVVSTEKEKAVFLLKSSPETLKCYPFEFELCVTYCLDRDTLKIDYTVSNKGQGDMYFAIGAHEAYACPEGIEDYSVIFEKEEIFESNVLHGNLLGHETIVLGKNTCELPLKYEYFAIDAQNFLNLKSRKATLKNRKTGKSIEVCFDGLDYFLLWTKPTGRYICLEPWTGVPDFVDSDYDFTHKKGIIKLASGEVCSKKHSIKL